MSRSKRKTPICGITTAKSETFDKACWHRAFRRAENLRLATDPESEAHHIREFSDPWSMQKDGKCYWGDEHRDAKWLRK
ncbi:MULTISPECIES: hypothetical protein [Pseudomonadaceae]|uniref:Uncharacterized protein n=1 Tax=Phytopseudomonas dryadis TaxID=2487520 RepID=A0ABY1Z169_9GAMM|nr:MULTISPECIES: hypothetical protein [Pseudomonadaceae]TBV01237.1 hypothetical protein DNK34_21615 [Pseudomonas dryadis]TBV14725.1 hypothetical protein DNK41_19445 [Pseudomonas sp. FRB 230]TBV16692.1 hypothetical protein DNK01_02210 [Stutzerimonas kirkiae]